MTLYIHVGSHKTGTTAIQKCAAANRSVLRSHGLWYPSNQEIGRAEYHGHHHFAHAIAGQSEPRFSLDDVKAFCNLLREGHTRNDITLLSAEPIFRHFYGDSTDVWARRRAYLSRLRDLLDITDIVIVIVLRRHFFARSLYHEKIKARGYKRSFGNFIRKDSWNFDYYTHVSLLSDVFLEVKVLIYEDLIVGGLINNFFKSIGFDGPSIAIDGVSNRSLPLELIEYKRLLNRTPGVSGDELRIIAKKLTGMANRGGFDWPEDTDWLSSRDMRAFIDGFRQNNERLRQQFLPERSAPLFPDVTDSDVPERGTYRGMSVERFAEITMRLLRMGVRTIPKP